MPVLEINYSREATRFCIKKKKKSNLSTSKANKHFHFYIYLLVIESTPVPGEIVKKCH